MGFFDTLNYAIGSSTYELTSFIGDTTRGIVDIFTPEGHSELTTVTKHYYPIWEDNGKDHIPRLKNPAYDVITTKKENDGILVSLFGDVEKVVEHSEDDATNLIEHSEDDAMKVIDNTEDDVDHVVNNTVLAGEHVTEAGLDLVGKTVDDIGELGSTIANDTKDLFQIPLLIVAGGIALMLYVAGNQAPQIVQSAKYM